MSISNLRWLPQAKSVQVYTALRTKDFYSAHELLSACVLAVFLFFYFFVHLCICIISLSCKGGQRWWVFVPLWQPASHDIFCMLVLILRRINMMMMMMISPAGGGGVITQFTIVKFWHFYYFSIVSSIRFL